MRVADVLKGKGSAIKSIAPTATVRELAEMLRAADVGAMIVGNSEKAGMSDIVGIVTERDVVRGYAVHGPALETMHVSEIMTRRVITCSPDDPISTIAHTMTERRIRHLPVRDGDRLVGIVSIGDVLKRRIDEVQLEANVLRDYAIAHR